MSGRRVKPAKSMSHWNPPPTPAVYVHKRGGQCPRRTEGDTSSSNMDRVTCPTCLTGDDS